MPPKPALKEKVVKGDEADVSANLKNRVPKAAVQKIMAALAEKGSLTVKPYGKQTIYVYNQTQLDVLAPEELASLDAELKSAQVVLDEQKKELKGLQAELTSQESTPKTNEINKEIERLRAENTTLLKTLSPYRGATDGAAAITPMSAGDIKRIDDDFAKWRKEWVQRKKVYQELLGLIADGGQIQSIPEFEEDQGITADDDDAKEVEDGEFCRPPARAIPQRKAPAKGPPVMAASSKRTSTEDSSQSVEEPSAKKKKGKKA